jgi:hypothetical protein
VGRTVTFDLDGVVYEAVTDGDGRASVTVPPTSRGRDQQVTVTFPGDEVYAPSVTHALVRWDPSGRGGGGAGGAGAGATGAGSGGASAGVPAAGRAGVGGFALALGVLGLLAIALVGGKRQHLRASLQATSEARPAR